VGGVRRWPSSILLQHRILPRQHFFSSSDLHLAACCPEPRPGSLWLNSFSRVGGGYGWA
jgi:hypothetical protein